MKKLLKRILLWLMEDVVREIVKEEMDNIKSEQISQKKSLEEIVNETQSALISAVRDSEIVITNG